MGKFGSATAKFFDFMFQVTILDLVFATMILGLVFVPQVTLPENSNNSTGPENCIAKNYSNVSFYRSFQNYSDTTCCSREYEKILIKAKERSTDRNFLDYGNPHIDFTFIFQTAIDIKSITLIP